MNPFRAVALGAALVALVTAAGCGGGGGESTEVPQSTVPATSSGQGAETSPVPSVTVAPHASVAPPTTVPVETPTGGAIEIHIDVDTTGNTANTLGSLDSCVRVDVPNPAFDGVSDYNIDVVVAGDTQPLAADNVQVNWDNTALVHIADPGTNIDIKMPGAIDGLSDPRPDSDGSFNAGAFYATGGPGVPGDGALARLGLDFGGSGIVHFALGPEPFSAYQSIAGDHPMVVDPTGGTVAINTDCPQ